jgi:hypothetical protein
MFSQLVAVNTSETGDTEALDYFPEASSSRARSLCIFNLFFGFVFLSFSLKKGNISFRKESRLGTRDFVL